MKTRGSTGVWVSTGYWGIYVNVVMGGHGSLTQDVVIWKVNKGGHAHWNVFVCVCTHPPTPCAPWFSAPGCFFFLPTLSTNNKQVNAIATNYNAVKSIWGFRTAMFPSVVSQSGYCWSVSAGLHVSVCISLYISLHDQSVCVCACSIPKDIMMESVGGLLPNTATYWKSKVQPFQPSLS